MSTFRTSLLNASIVPSGASYQPYSNFVTTVRDQIIITFDAATDNELRGSFSVPQNWVTGTTKVVPIWTSETAANNVVWEFYHRSVDNGEQLETNTTPVTDTGDSVTTSSKPPNANEKSEDPITLDTTEWAAGNLIQFVFRRDADNGSDTKADLALLFGLELEYSDA